MISSRSCNHSISQKNLIIWFFKGEEFVEGSSQFKRSCNLFTLYISENR